MSDGYGAATPPITPNTIISFSRRRGQEVPAGKSGTGPIGWAIERDGELAPRRAGRYARNLRATRSRSPRGAAVARLFDRSPAGLPPLFRQAGAVAAADANQVDRAPPPVVLEERLATLEQTMQRRITILRRPPAGKACGRTNAKPNGSRGCPRKWLR